MIIDFEGEPDRPLAQRRAKQSPLLDVAGMIRAFDYAAYAALFAFLQNRPVEFDRLKPWADLWRLHTSAAFLDAYQRIATGATAASRDSRTDPGGNPFPTPGRSLLPPDPDHRWQLLRFFILNKALYELQYELNHRPGLLHWVRIPLAGILDMAEVHV